MRFCPSVENLLWKTNRQSARLPKEKTLMEKLAFNEPLLTTAAVAKWLGISTRAVCLWAECKELPAIKLGRQWRFRRDELSEWLRSTNADKVKNYTGSRRAAAGV
jgi:excisionase family DNA binding protein